MIIIDLCNTIKNMDLNNYNNEIKDLLESYHDRIEADIMPKLAKDFTRLYMGITEIYGKLKNRGLIKDDPYQNASEIIEIIIPDAKPYPESEASWKVPERIGKYISVLSYITHNYTFSLSNINFDELEKIKKFLDYYKWEGLLNPITTDINTMGFGKLVISLRTSIKDSIIISTIDKCVEGIIDSNKEIINKLKYILLYLKESYKQFIRLDLLPIISTEDKNPELLISLVKDEIVKNYSYLKFYKKYILEVINEEFSVDSQVLKEGVLKKLGINNKQNKSAKETKEDPEKELMAILVEIGKTRNHLETSIEKLNTNHLSLSSKEGSFFKKLFRNISIFLFNIRPKTNYNIKVLISNDEKKSIDLQFEEFYDSVKKMEFNLLDFSEEGRAMAFIKNHPDDVKKSVDKILMDIKRIIKFFMALDTFFKVELKIRGIKSKGIKPELTVLKSIINSSTSLYKDFLDTHHL